MAIPARSKRWHGRPEAVDLQNVRGTQFRVGIIPCLTCKFKSRLVLTPMFMVTFVEHESGGMCKNITTSDTPLIPPCFFAGVPRWDPVPSVRFGLGVPHARDRRSSTLGTRYTTQKRSKTKWTLGDLSVHFVSGCALHGGSIGHTKNSPQRSAQ